MTESLDRAKVTEHLADLERRIEGQGELRELLSTAESDAYREQARLESQREEFRRLVAERGLTPDPVVELRAAAVEVLEAAEAAPQVIMTPVGAEPETRPMVPWGPLEQLRKALGG